MCCESACNGVCEACDAAGKCMPVSGAPKHGKCDGDASGPCAGTCDGTMRDACTYPDVECGSASCAAGTATLAPRCKAGTCPAPTTQKCTLGCFEDGCLGVQQVAAGYYHTCALLTDGKVRCWGANDYGESGQGTTGTGADVKTPTEVLNLSNAKGIAATFSTTCALMGDGSVRCWGNNTGGQLGRGTTDTNPHPEHAPVTGIAGATFLRGSSGGHFCAIVAGGESRCWGGNGAGQLGDGTSGGSKSTPVTVCQPGGAACPKSSGATFVVGGDGHTCAIFAGDKVACWGSNNAGELGRPSSASDKDPDFVTPSFTAKYLTAGNQATCAVDTAGVVHCWGSNNLGALGNGSASGSTSPGPVCTKQDCSTHLGGAIGVSTYDESTCAVANGAVKCWGTNFGGQLGDGNATASQNYAATSAIASGAAYVASGGGAHFAIVVDGANRDLRCWGSESRYQCGVGTTTEPRKTPVAPTW